MSEDETEFSVDRDRRAPRFSWTPAYETTFFRSLCDSVQLGLRENSSFKAEAWERAAQALQDSHGARPTKSHLINKSDNARKRFRLWRGLREAPDFLYDRTTKTVIATEDSWKAHIEREPLSRALRGRPFDHEEYMEILYPDVIGSGGAPKRVLKQRRRPEGNTINDSDMPGTAVFDLRMEPSPSQIVISADKSSPCIGQGPTTNPTALLAHSPPPDSVPPAAAQGTVVESSGPLSSALAEAPPDESTNLVRKRALPQDFMYSPFDVAPGPSSTALGYIQQAIGSPDKRARTVVQSDTQARVSAIMSNGSIPPEATPSSYHTTPASVPAALAHVGGQGVNEVGSVGERRDFHWQEAALDLFFREFSERDLDLQIAISESVLCDEYKALLFCKMPWPSLPFGPITPQIFFSPLSSVIMSYAEVAASGPRQSPREASAPQPPEILSTHSASTASLIDVDVPSVHTVRSEFLDQDVQTTTQAERRNRETSASKAKAKAADDSASASGSKKKDAGAVARSRAADSWLTKHFADLSDGNAGALAAVNLAAIIGLSSYMGYRAWGLYDKGSLDWKTAGIGLSVLAAVGAMESVFGRYLYKGKKKGDSS